MERQTHPVQPEGSAITQVRVGMVVVDVAGDDVGTVSAVQQPDTDVRPDLAAGEAENLMGLGYLRVDGTGALATDVYVGGHQVADVSDAAGGGRVTLTVLRDHLHRPQ
jgi:hypothetical protein